MPFPGRLTGGLARAWNGEGIWSVANQATISGMSFVVSVIAARLLGIEDFGRFAMIMAFITVIGSVHYHLVSGPMFVLAGLREKRSNAYFLTLRRGLLASSLFAGLVVAVLTVCLFAGRDGGVSIPLIMAAGVAAIGQVLHDGMTRILFARRRARAAFVLQVVRHTLFALICVAIWASNGLSLATLLLAVGIPPIVVMAPLAARSLRRNRTNTRMARPIAQRHWKVGRWMVLMVLVTMLQEQLATVVAGLFAGDTEAAGVRGAQIILGPFLILIMSLENIVPRVAADRLRAGGPQASFAYLSRLGLLIAPVIAIGCVAVILFAESLTTFLLGKDFARYAPTVRILALTPPILVLRDLSMVYLRAIENTRAIFRVFATSSLVAAAAIVPSVMISGAKGAAAVIVTCHALSAAMLMLTAARHRSANMAVST
ncbi:lipopolysaccharide biosynthesis protein [Aquamicrobium sp. LC103]|uniref:lipopolysaccharide biosynthesis protein n=1 Tax=Aquamicrobium sp. LC103 TaxID=1120658 RepID=UPI000A879831|nr:lipopolysaccharide biosynthesis protein [Aquamicrobium sp. LC103]TKT77457.1 lipopolysaccharide biosynthesis protein [Aquamicrobium sp. LC103]